jgi:DNA replication protein DnaC
MQEDRELQPLPPGIRTLTDEEIERLRAEHDDLPRSPQQCITCKGKKEFLGIDGHRYRCDCVSQFILHRYLLHCGIGLLYQRLSWMDLRRDHPQIDTLMAYVDDAESNLNAGLGMMLYGDRGTGKTMFAVLCLKALLARGYDGYLTEFRRMLDSFKGGFRDTEARQWFYRRVSNVGFLVIDEVTMEARDKDKSYDWPLDTLEDVIRHRVAHARPTILTTNYNPEDVKRGYGAGIISLLSEQATILRFSGDDFRPTHKLRLEEEVKRHLTRPVVLG